MRDEWNEDAYEVVKRLQQATSKQEVADIMVGVSRYTFMEIDEKPMRYDTAAYDTWFPWLRQLRNDPTNDFFDRLV